MQFFVYIQFMYQPEMREQFLNENLNYTEHENLKEINEAFLRKLNKLQINNKKIIIELSENSP